ncbi:MAG: diphthamide synthesis protein [Candidatus Woesearchaeota archaeon]|jgi:diphthamide biosynthesis enzyme Dph1/Dph2-like protein
MEYDLELQRAITEIQKAKAKVVCIQLPDGLKQQAQNICNTLETETGASVIIWLSSCYGACDWPLGIEKAGVDMLIAWGHSAWKQDLPESIQ